MRRRKFSPSVDGLEQKLCLDGSVLTPPYVAPPPPVINMPSMTIVVVNGTDGSTSTITTVKSGDTVLSVWTNWQQGSLQHNTIVANTYDTSGNKTQTITEWWYYNGVYYNNNPVNPGTPLGNPPTVGTPIPGPTGTPISTPPVEGPPLFPNPEPPPGPFPYGPNTYPAPSTEPPVINGPYLPAYNPPVTPPIVYTPPVYTPPPTT